MPIPFEFGKGTKKAKKNEKKKWEKKESYRVCKSESVARTIEEPQNQQIEECTKSAKWN